MNRREDIQVILNPDHIDLEPVIGLDLETTGLQAWVDRIVLIIINTSEKTYILDTSKYHPDYLREVFQNISLCERVIAHNAKFDCGFIYSHYGILLRNWFCTQISSQIITNGKIEYQGRHSLPEVIERYLGETLQFTHTKKLMQKSFTSQYALSSFTEKQLHYAADDVKFLIPLYSVLDRQIDNLEMRAIGKLEMDLIPVLAKMEVEGCLVDAENWTKLIKSHWEPSLHEIEQKLDVEVRKLIPLYAERRVTETHQLDIFGGVSTTKSAAQETINYGSQDQIIKLFKELGEEVPSVIVDEKPKKHDNTNTSNILYNLFDVPQSGELGGEESSRVLQERVVKGKNGKIKKESLEETVLTTYINERPNSRMKPFIKELLNYRVAAKRISTYGEKFLSQLDVYGRIHTGYTQTFTATGRLSSKSPNLQNIPAPEKGKPETDIRRFFVARPGYKLVTCDMAGAEIAIAADYSQEPLILGAIRDGVDMHSQLASVSFSIIFGQDFTVSKSEIPVEVLDHNGFVHTLVPGELRDHHKSVVFAKFYKAGAKRVYSVLAQYINMFHSEDKRMEIAQRISDALDKRLPKLSKYLDGLIKRAQKTGMMRSDKLGRIRYFTEDVYGEAANYPIQGTNANALKMALVEIFLYFESCGFDGRIVMNIHDEVVVEIEETYAEIGGKKVQEIMGNALSYFLKTIKGGAGIKISNHWQK